MSGSQRPSQLLRGLQTVEFHIARYDALEVQVSDGLQDSKKHRKEAR